ncbi:MAG TPA: response regulator transcription factor [Cyclobacteriaceae bacterium]|jgi:DNA-binding NarL/FixJ family response regulator|nr:response regulator transcription factor [Cyclobacteriaceae bacterium]HRK55614.1 response regulator transcription factor [Cyclobacteriaceae bacterium]
MKEGLKFLLVDDHAIVRRGLNQILKDEFSKAIITEVGDADGAMDAISGQEFDLVICDISIPGTTGLELCKNIKKVRPSQPMLVLSMHKEEQYAVRALKVGASGYLAKESAPEELIKAVRQILAGKKYVSTSLAAILVNHLGDQGQQELHEILSDRELEVLKQIAKGKSLTEIGKKLNLSPNTISTYRARILEKMNMKTNAELIQYVLEHKLE